MTVENGVPTSCECPADTYRSGACKHRVAVAIREPVLEAAGAQSREVATDGGVVVDERTVDRDDVKRPADCDCLPTFDDLPCWACYRDGFRSPNPDVDDE